MKPHKELLNPQWLLHMIYAGPPRVSIQLASQGSTVGHFNMADIGALTILLPPRPEQDRIVATIFDLTAGIERTITRLEREIDILCECSTRLVADVVTGKLDVREAAARLPVESAPDAAEILVKESESLDEPELANEEELPA